MGCRCVRRFAYFTAYCLHLNNCNTKYRGLPRHLILYLITKILWNQLQIIKRRVENVTSRFATYNQQDATFHNLFIFVRRSTCFRRVFRPSSGAQNCTYSVRYLSDHYCYLLLACRLAAGSSIGLTNT